jgi:hypothetical protein
MTVLLCAHSLGQEAVGERNSRSVPTVTVAGRNARRDVQTLADIGHAGIALTDCALQLAVKALIVEIQFHAFGPFLAARLDVL